MLRAANPAAGQLSLALGTRGLMVVVCHLQGEFSWEVREEMSYQLLNPWSVLGTLPAMCPTYSRHSVNKGMGG